MSPIKLFVIIVTYNGQRWYERCFTSLRESELPVQTIVIDNASNDGTVEYIREYFPEIHLIESKENLGFGRANNIGMRYALDHGCDYVFLLNQDAWIEPNTLSELVRVHQKYPEYGILSPMHLTRARDHLNMLLDDGKYNHDLLSDLYCHSINDVYTISYANAAAWLISCNTLKMIGGFCPMFFYRGEDDDYMNRMKYHKMLMGLCPNTRVVHDTETRLEGSIELAKKAISNNLHNILDINSLEPFPLLCYHFRKYVLNMMKCKFQLTSYHCDKIKYIVLNYKELTDIRKQHKTLNSHWL